MEDEKQALKYPEEPIALMPPDEEENRLIDETFSYDREKAKNWAQIFIEKNQEMLKRLAEK